MDGVDWRPRRTAGIRDPGKPQPARSPPSRQDPPSWLLSPSGRCACSRPYALPGLLRRPQPELDLQGDG